MIVNALNKSNIRITCINGEWFVLSRDTLIARNGDDIFVLLNRRYSDKRIRVSPDVARDFIYGSSLTLIFEVSTDSSLPKGTLVSSEMNTGGPLRAKNVMVRISHIDCGDPSKYEDEKKWILDQVDKQKQ
jgi:hypothetical protein